MTRVSAHPFKNIAGPKYSFQIARKVVHIDTIVNYLPLLINSYSRDDSREREWGLSNQPSSIVVDGRRRWVDFSNRDIAEPKGHYKNYKVHSMSYNIQSAGEMGFTRTRTKKTHHIYSPQRTSLATGRSIQAVLHKCIRYEELDASQYTGLHNNSSNNGSSNSSDYSNLSKQEVDAVQDWLRWLEEQEQEQDDDGQLSLIARRAIAIANAERGL